LLSNPTPEFYTPKASAIQLKHTEFYYKEFPEVLAKVPYNNFDIYVKKWRDNWGGAVQQSYALKIYRLIFEKTWPQAPPFKPQRINNQLIPGHKNCLHSSPEALVAKCSNHILTDSPQPVIKLLKGTKIINSFFNQKTQFYILETPR